jgi:hypothetical protein
MITVLLNYGHTFTPKQLAQLSTLLRHAPTVCDVPTQVDRAVTLAAKALQLAELHGRCGYFLPIIDIRPVANALPPRYEVAEIANLNSMHEQARTRR